MSYITPKLLRANAERVRVRQQHATADNLVAAADALDACNAGRKLLAKNYGDISTQLTETQIKLEKRTRELGKLKADLLRFREVGKRLGVFQ